MLLVRWKIKLTHTLLALFRIKNCVLDWTSILLYILSNKTNLEF